MRDEITDEARATRVSDEGAMKPEDDSSPDGRYNSRPAAARLLQIHMWLRQNDL